MLNGLVNAVPLTPQEARATIKALRRGRATIGLDRLDQLAASISPSMVTNALTNNITAKLEEAFYTWPDTWKLWTRQGKSERLDRQVIEVIGQLGMIDKLQETGGEYNIKRIPDAQEVGYNIYGYGNIAVVDFRTLTNDRLGYFAKLGERLGRAAVSRLHQSIYIDNLQANPTFYDGNALFDETNHGNDMDDAKEGVTPTYDQVVTAFGMLDSIVDSASEPLDVDGAYIITGSHWREVFDQIVENSMKPDTEKHHTNTIRKRVKGVVYSRKLGYDWYVIADPKELPGLNIDFYKGQQIPQVVSERKDSSFQFTHPGRQRWRIGHEYGFVWEYYQSAIRGSQNVLNAG
jgi:hypothetical protein